MHLKPDPVAYCFPQPPVNLYHTYKNRLRHSKLTNNISLCITFDDAVGLFAIFLNEESSGKEQCSTNNGDETRHVERVLETQIISDDVIFRVASGDHIGHLSIRKINMIISLLCILSLIHGHTAGMLLLQLIVNNSLKIHLFTLNVYDSK